MSKNGDPMSLLKDSAMKEKIAKVLLLGAMAAILSSVAFPYWRLTVRAPQYPKGLSVHVFLNHVTGDVREIDGLNHYIGMRPLEEAAPVEKRFAMAGICLVALCLLVAIFIRGRISFLLILPAIALPAIFAGDLYIWLRDFGLHLNPHAPFSSSVKPFIPPLLGHGKIAQFQASANFALGHGLSMLSAILSIGVILLRFVGKKGSDQPKVLRALVLFLAFSGIFNSQEALAETLTVSPTAYVTIQAAVAKASDGDSILVKPGAYHGPLVIDKSLKLIGEGNPIIDGDGKGTVVRINAPDTLLRGFMIRNSGINLTNEDSGVVVMKPGAVIENNQFKDVLFGVYLRNAAGSIIRSNRLTGKSLAIARRGDLIRVWYSDNVTIEGNEVSRGRDVVLWFSKNLRVLKNDFHHSRYGLHFMFCKDALVEFNHLTHNSVGAYLMYSSGLKLAGNTLSDNRGPSGYGVGFKDMEEATLENNIISSNRVGFFLDGCAHGISRKNTIIYNEIGIQISPSTRNNEFSGNNVIDNGEQITLDKSSSMTVNDWTGNYWSDYRGFDVNRDGIGDLPYRPMNLFEKLTDHFHSLRIFSGSPSVQAIDFAASTFPIFAPTPKFEDAHPRMRPTPMTPANESAPHSMLWGMVSLLLVLPVLGFLKINTELSSC